METFWEYTNICHYTRPLLWNICTFFKITCLFFKKTRMPFQIKVFWISKWFFIVPNRMLGMHNHSLKKFGEFFKNIKKMLEGPLLSLRQFLTADTLLKMMKNAFYFIWKLVSFLRYLHFYGYVEKRLDTKDKVKS